MILTIANSSVVTYLFSINQTISMSTTTATTTQTPAPVAPKKDDGPSDSQGETTKPFNSSLPASASIDFVSSGIAVRFSDELTETHYMDPDARVGLIKQWSVATNTQVQPKVPAPSVVEQTKSDVPYNFVPAPKEAKTILATQLTVNAARQSYLKAEAAHDQVFDQAHVCLPTPKLDAYLKPFVGGGCYVHV